MPSRRSLLASAVALVGAGCLSRGESDVDPAEHVPDDWHEDPKRGLADPLTMSASKLSEHPQNDCKYLAAETGAEVLEDRLDNPENVYGGGCCRAVDGHDQVIVWERHVTVNRDGNVISSPNIEFQTVREAAPRTIQAPEESDHDCQIPVYVKDVMSHLA
jgi:hypothetical protein